ncbi:MAG: hypothetical protein EOP09_19325 [Proteobacteria bacterium]|nr:MAG: hypothetical protein EOP09_19325 [Pseudomonadota bacterium]
MIHEGLADFFVYARTGNACLGETICPVRSTMCAKVGQCLRSGENVLKFTDGGLSKTAHLRSQVLSGMMWDIGKKIGLEKTGLIAFTAVDYLLPRSTYVDLTLGLMKADLELNKGVNSCLILEEAKNRALDSSLANVNCNDYVAP